MTVEPETFAALASPKRLQILDWLRDPLANFPPHRDGDHPKPVRTTVGAELLHGMLVEITVTAPRPS